MENDEAIEMEKKKQILTHFEERKYANFTVSFL